jgi:hypothetical protein
MFYRKANPALMRQDIAAVVGRSAAKLRSQTIPTVNDQN